MGSLTDIFSRSAGSAILLLFLLLAVLAALVIGQAIGLSRLRRRWRGLLEGVRGDNLERLLQDQLRHRVVLESELAEIKKEIDSLERRMGSAKRHLGLVRYDAFEDVGGAQSFALALYDEKGDGLVMSSLIGRADCRVYCKPLTGGRSERNLSDEERKAIEEAASGRSKPIISL